MSHHPPFPEVEASRPDFDTSKTFKQTKTPAPAWKLGSGGNDNGASLSKNHVEIDPYAEGRESGANYKLMISAITPRFIGFISTRSADGKSTNLAPFSYTTVLSHDPPMFAVGIDRPIANAKDTTKNLLETKECVINVISEHFIEAANATSIDAPNGISEWAISGLHPAKSSTVKADRVKEAVFAVEGKLVHHHEWESRNPATPGKKTSVTVLIEGTRFWAREDAIDKEYTTLDPNILKPVSRMGGITYARTTEAFELPRPKFEEVDKEGKLDGLKAPLVDGQ